MSTYPLTPPAECPAYVVASVQQRCDQALNLVLQGVDIANFQLSLRNATDSELHLLRGALDTGMANGVPAAEDWWVRWGSRTVTQAWQDAVTLARFRDALASPEFGHMTSGHPVSPNHYHVYLRDSASPTGCRAVASAAHSLPGVMEVIEAAKVTSCQGGQRGSRGGR